MTRPFAGTSPLRDAAALADAAATVTRRIPAPRGLPFYGLDHPRGVLDRALSALSDLGIFRRYSHVLDVAGGLGGPARWLARRHACRVTIIEPDREVAAASALLTERAFLTESVDTIACEPARLPFASDTFTHAWWIAPPRASKDRRSTLAETARVLRPGGWIALAERLPESRAVVLAALCENLESAGFRDLTTIDLETLIEDDSTAARLTAERTAGAFGTGVEADDESSLVGIRARKPS